MVFLEGRVTIDYLVLDAVLLAQDAGISLQILALDKSIPFGNP